MPSFTRKQQSQTLYPLAFLIAGYRSERDWQRVCNGETVRLSDADPRRPCCTLDVGKTGEVRIWSADSR